MTVLIELRGNHELSKKKMSIEPDWPRTIIGREPLQNQLGRQKPYNQLLNFVCLIKN